MTNASWTFTEDPWFDQDFSAVKFAAVRGPERVVCAISRIAINDRFHTEDTREAAIRNYHEHSDWVHSTAIRLIERGRPHQNGFYLITSQVAQEFGDYA
jgi:hypothetical protein